MNWLTKISSIRLLHGTSSSFDEFDLSHVGQRDFGDFGYGIYLTKKDGLAKAYAYESAKASGGEPVVLEVIADVTSMADFDDPELFNALTNETGVPAEKELFPGQKQTRPKADSLAIRDFLISRGFDGVYGRGRSEVVIFDSSKLRIVRKFNADSDAIPFWLDQI